MSLVFVVDSEEQVAAGAPWCARLVETTGLDLHVVVTGADRKSLREHTRKRLAETFGVEPRSISIAGIADEPSAVLAHARSLQCSLLLLLHRRDGGDREQKLFEGSPWTTIWLCATGPPPASSQQLVEAIRSRDPIATTTSERVLGLIPGSVIFESDRFATLPRAQHNTAVIEAINSTDLDSGDLLLVGIHQVHHRSVAYTVGRELLDANMPASVMLIRSADSLGKRITDRFESCAQWIAEPMDREQRTELASDLEAGSKPNLEFLGLISAAAMLAAFGLLQDSAAVIIGAMLIAPLMTPILGAGMALSHGNRPLFFSAWKTILLGFLGALGSSILFGLLVRTLQTPEITGEMWARCRPSPLDFCVGTVGGMAAAYARTRSHLSSALAGAAIAAALVPPISTAGLQIAFGQWPQAEDASMSEGVPITGPLLLVGINVLTIMIGSCFVLWFRGIRGDHRFSLQSRWAPRMTVLLLVLTLLILVGVFRPAIVFFPD